MKIWGRLSLGLYFLFLSWLILFKLSVNIGSFLANHHGRSLNLIPLASSGGRLEVLLNVLVFIPLALMLAVVMKQWSFGQKFFLLVLLSFVYESLQYIFAIGATDITDLITNSLGALIGLGIYWLFTRIFSEESLDKVCVVATWLVMLAFVGVTTSHLLLRIIR